MKLKVGDTIWMTSEGHTGEFRIRGFFEKSDGTKMISLWESYDGKYGDYYWDEIKDNITLEKPKELKTYEVNVTIPPTDINSCVVTTTCTRFGNLQFYPNSDNVKSIKVIVSYEE